MTLAGRKRGFSTFSEDYYPTSQVPKRPDTQVQASVETARSEVQKKEQKVVLKAKRNKRAAAKTLQCTVATYKTPSNPQATFEGLPAELRLQIYDYLCDSSIIHVHRKDKLGSMRTCFTWTPCRSPNPKSPLLCANPKWSGMCDEQDRCTYKIYAPPEPIGFWALTASNKSIRNEAQEFFLRRTVVSISPKNLRAWLDYLHKHMPRFLDHVRRITLAGPSTYHSDMTADVQLLRDRVPNLEGVGVQCQDTKWRWIRSYASNTVQVNPEAWKRWNVIDLVRPFDASVEVALEAIVWRKNCPRRLPTEPEQQFAVRILRPAVVTESGQGKVDAVWEEENVDVEIVHPKKLIAWKRNAKWRQWWRGQEMMGFG